MPMFMSWNSSPPLPPAFSSTTLTAEEPMSTPTTLFFLLPNRATGASLQRPTLRSDSVLKPATVPAVVFTARGVITRTEDRSTLIKKS